MSDIERDPIVRRAIDELQQLPSADAAAIRRVVAAAAAARVAPSDDEVIAMRTPAWRRQFWPIVGLAAAAAFVGFVANGIRRPAQPAPVVTSAAVPVTALPSDVQPVANTGEALPVPYQFVFNSRKAHAVAVVGDFNGWSPSHTPMTRASDGDLWSVTIPIVPGRHMYAFMVDDSVYTLDPRAPKARDRDLGTDGSVAIVGRP